MADILFFILLLSGSVAVFQLIFFVLPVFLTKGGAPYVPSSRSAVKKILKLAEPKSDENILDLGSGDGRIVVAFAKLGIEAHGYEISPALVLWSRFRIILSGLWNKAHIHQESLWNADLSGFDTIILFGYRKIMPDLEKKFRQELKPGAKVISNLFKIPGLEPSKTDGEIYRYDGI